MLFREAKIFFRNSQPAAEYCVRAQTGKHLGKPYYVVCEGRGELYTAETNKHWSRLIGFVSLEWCGSRERRSLFWEFRCSVSSWACAAFSLPLANASCLLTQSSTHGINEATTRAPPAMWNAGPYEPSLSTVKPSNGIMKQSQSDQNIIVKLQV